MSQSLSNILIGTVCELYTFHTTQSFIFSEGGPITIKVSTCSAPSNSVRQIRRVDEGFLKLLKKRMIEDAAAPGVPPIAVLCGDVQVIDQFRPHLKNHYNYEVLGGLHTTVAKQQLMNEVPGESYSTTSMLSVQYACT